VTRHGAGRGRGGMGRGSAAMTRAVLRECGLYARGEVGGWDGGLVVRQEGGHYLGHRTNPARSSPTPCRPMPPRANLQPPAAQRLSPQLFYPLSQHWCHLCPHAPLSALAAPRRPRLAVPGCTTHLARDGAATPHWQSACTSWGIALLRRGRWAGMGGGLCGHGGGRVPRDRFRLGQRGGEGWRWSAVL
jgi:hypothetical protein